GRAHHREPVRPDRLEHLLHGRVARRVEEAPRRSVRIGGHLAEDEVGGGEQLAEKRQVGGDGAEQLGPRGLGKGGDLDLAAGLQGERRAGRKRELWTVLVQRAGRVRPQGGGEPVRVEWPPRVVLVMDDPFQLDTGESRRAVLEADRSDVGLSLHAVGQAVPVGLNNLRTSWYWWQRGHQTLPSRGRNRRYTRPPTITRQRTD